MKKTTGLLIGFVFLVLILTSNVLALTGSIGNGRAVIYPNLNESSSIDRTILVQNKNDVPVNIKIEADENSSEMLNIIDSAFVLQAGEEKDARFTVNIKEEGDYELRLNVFFVPIDGKGAGVALPATIVVHATGVAVDKGVIGNAVNSVVKLFGKSTKGNGPVIIVTVSTLVLVIIFIVLVILLRKKKENDVIKEKKVKRSDRSS